jgi:hypothetical protein
MHEGHSVNYRIVLAQAEFVFALEEIEIVLLLLQVLLTKDLAQNDPHVEVRHLIAGRLDGNDAVLTAADILLLNENSFPCLLEPLGHDVHVIVRAEHRLNIQRLRQLEGFARKQLGREFRGRSLDHKANRRLGCRARACGPWISSGGLAR